MEYLFAPRWAYQFGPTFQPYEVRKFRRQTPYLPCINITVSSTKTMAPGKEFLFFSWCGSCRIALLGRSASLASPPLRLSSHISLNKLGGQSQILQRCFSRFPHPRSELVNWKASTSVEGNGQYTGKEEDDGDSTALEPQPWYLHVQTPQRESKPMSDRQRLPDLPPDPPPLLQPMLQHISVDLGLDDLSLLDLRDIDPPPALGAHLLMILGTARSEKHLHVSADRFCRWLRTTYKLIPYADGLLGRGELRLKLKRKNRRARMLNSVGASDSSNTDDGIRTGWVCVNVGIIEDGGAVEQDGMHQEHDDYVGFGGESTGVKVVVQMLTEEKREELDLETLWGQALARYTRRRDRISKGQQEDSPAAEAFPPALGSIDSPSALSLAP